MGRYSRSAVGLASDEVELQADGPNVYFLKPEPGRLGELVRLLERHGARVVLTGVDGIPESLVELRRFQALWLANVATQELTQLTSGRAVDSRNRSRAALLPAL